MDLTPRAIHSLRLVESRFWWNLDWLKPLFSGGKEDAIQEPIGGVIIARPTSGNCKGRSQRRIENVSEAGAELIQDFTSGEFRMTVDAY